MEDKTYNPFFSAWRKGDLIKIYGKEIRLISEAYEKMGVHNYETIGSQNTKGLVGGFSMIPLMRGVKKCKRCGKVYFVGYDIGTNAHLDETLDWQPKLNY